MTSITYPRGRPPTLLRQLVAQGVARRLRVAQEHGVIRLVEDWVVRTSIPNTHRALQDHGLLRLPDLDDWHASDGAVRVLLRARVHRVVRANDYRHVRLRKVGVDLLHLLDDVVRDTSLRE